MAARNIVAVALGVILLTAALFCVFDKFSEMETPETTVTTSLAQVTDAEKEEELKSMIKAAMSELEKEPDAAAEQKQALATFSTSSTAAITSVGKIMDPNLGDGARTAAAFDLIGTVMAVLPPPEGPAFAAVTGLMSVLFSTFGPQAAAKTTKQPLTKEEIYEVVKKATTEALEDKSIDTQATVLHAYARDLKGGMDDVENFNEFHNYDQKMWAFFKDKIVGNLCKPGEVPNQLFQASEHCQKIISKLVTTTSPVNPDGKCACAKPVDCNTKTDKIPSTRRLLGGGQVNCADAIKSWRAGNPQQEGNVATKESPAVKEWKIEEGTTVTKGQWCATPWATKNCAKTCCQQAHGPTSKWSKDCETQYNDAIDTGNNYALLSDAYFKTATQMLMYVRNVLDVFKKFKDAGIVDKTEIELEESHFTIQCQVKQVYSTSALLFKTFTSIRDMSKCPTFFKYPNCTTDTNAFTKCNADGFDYYSGQIDCPKDYGPGFVNVDNNQFGYSKNCGYYCNGLTAQCSDKTFIGSWKRTCSRCKYCAPKTCVDIIKKAAEGT